MSLLTFYMKYILKNFVQLCMEGYYDGTIFHRVVHDFIIQGGDPTGTGTGGESIYGHPFKDEFHSRLRFNRRGLVAMANAGPHDNGSQFFFTLGRADELNNKHTIFGKVTILCLPSSLVIHILYLPPPFPHTYTPNTHISDVTHWTNISGAV
uniref:Peptidyl-prolyl cis-trans isomerase n=1 Tax=Mola mola TaxID=94237 RepID=A0A3Q3WG10_MOLML